MQYTNYNAHPSNAYPGPSGQPDLHPYQNAQVMGSLPRAFNALTLSPDGYIGALGQRPTLGNLYTESQSDTGSNSDGMFAVVDENMYREVDVTMSGQRPKLELEPVLEVSESEKEEDDSDAEMGDDDDQDDDADGFNTTGAAGHLQTLQSSWIPWEAYTESNQLFDEDGVRVEVEGQANTGKRYGEETVNGSSHHVMYRRNYFKVEAQYGLTTTGKTTGQLFINLEGNMRPVEGIYATVRGAVEGNLAREIEISTFDAGRKKLGQGPSTIPLTPSNEEPVFEDSTAGNGIDLGLWRRMQWRKATENNGARRAKKSTYNIVVPFMVKIRARDSRRQQRGAGSSPATELIEIGYCMSGPIQARGRCPITFEAYDPTNMDHKRRRPNRGPIPSKFDSKTRRSKEKNKPNTKKTRQPKRRRIVPRTLTPSTGQTSFSRSPSRTATHTTVESSLSGGQAPTAPMAGFGAARTDVDSLSTDETSDFQRDILDEFGMAGEHRYQHPAATLMWPSQRESPPSGENLLRGISDWAYPSASEHPDAISEDDLNFYLP